MFTRKFWERATERALKTGAQALILGIGTAANFNAVEADWQYLGGMTLGGVVLGYAFSVISAPISGDKNDPSLVD